MPGPGPGIHPLPKSLSKMMDCWSPNAKARFALVPGNDDPENQN
jgi:hypothetical protein